MSEKCFVALSGGVDSAVTAALLKKQGYDVIGVTLRLKPENLADEDISHAKNICAGLSIPLEVIDLRDRFKEIVSDYFINDYLTGKTPNPCVFCNPIVKFAGILDYADKNGGGYIATGHYVECEKASDGTFLLKKAPTGKDQSYFLYRLNQQILSRTLFPLGKYTKPEVRQLAEENHLSVAQRKDSLEVCFIPDNDYIGYIENNYKELPLSGDFKDTSGKIIGTHSGIHKYTIGQRKGLGAFGEPKYVVKITAEDNSIILGSNDDLFTDEIIVDNLSWVSGKEPPQSFRAEVKIRCTARTAPAEITLLGAGSARISFEEKQRAAAPGQAAVIYDKNIVLGGGTITRT